MTPEQTAKVSAYNAIPQAVIDDLIVTTRVFADAHKLGAAELLLYIFSQRSAERREKARGPRTVKK